MKSIIGYYYLPLTGEEREKLQAHFKEIHDREYTERVVSIVKKEIDDCLSFHEKWITGDHLSINIETIIFLMNSRLRETFQKLIKEIPDIWLLRPQFCLDRDNKITVAGLDTIEKYYHGDDKLFDPNTSYLEDDSRLVSDYNTYLTEYPIARVFERTPLSLSIEEVNDQILARIDKQSFDFSDIILDIGKMFDRLKDGEQ